MISKNEVKYIQSLTHKKNRDAEGLFIAETPKLVAELLASDVEVKKIYATGSWQADSGGVPVEMIDEATLDRITSLEKPNQVLAVAVQKKMPFLQFKNRLSLALDGIQDPGNLGTIIRIADWFGIYQIVAAKDTADWYNAKVVQSSMGSIARVNVWYEDLAEVIAGAQVPVYGALLQGQNMRQVPAIEEGILLIGNESKGIREPVRSLVQHPITIPRFGKAESLNAAVATGILLSHLVK